ncbi:MAG: YiiX family permuted papain-like enzyme [Azoarcus sp.]|nr:YiiX family permuted papain-like enzyme [Azoarcus sp.]
MLAILASVNPAFAQAGGRFDAAVFREGDIIFQSSPSPQGKAIELATHSRYSHCGIILKIGNELHVYEAVGPVRYLPLQEWIALGKGGRYALRRLKNADTLLTAEAMDKIRKTGETFKGKPYDSIFGWSDERIYCSELVHKIYSRALGLQVGKIRRLGDFDLTHPTVQKELRQRYGKNIPLDEPVVSPQDVFESDLLVPVGSE